MFIKLFYLNQEIYKILRNEKKKRITQITGSRGGLEALYKTYI